LCEPRTFHSGFANPCWAVRYLGHVGASLEGW